MIFHVGEYKRKVIIDNSIATSLSLFIIPQKEKIKIKRRMHKF